MPNIKSYVREITITVLTFMWLLFVATNVNVTLGQTYLQFAVGSLVLLIIGITIFDKKLHITFQKEPGGTFKAILWGIGGWIALLITSVLVLRFIDPANANIAAIMGLLGASTPALATSKIANLITFGFAIAFIETQLWGRLMEFFGDLFHININKQSLKKIGLLFLIGILSLAFLFFHLTAKGITNTSALIVVFIMMFISLIMIAVFGETRQAVFMHISANTVASWLMLFASISI
jgi:hypothetical protein